MTQTYITLNDGNKIPQFGLGVYQVPEGEATVNAVKTALEMGIRRIDTTHAYQNERSVGKAVKESGISREEIWITTKLWPSEYGEGKTSQAIDKMLKRLDTDYIDLLLLHQQFGDYIGAYKDMERAVKFDFELTEDEMNEIRKLDSGKRFFNMTLEQQEQMLGSWKPED